MVRTATEKTVDPPMKTTRRGVLGDLDLMAGGMTNVREMDALQPLMPPGAYRVETGWQDINDIRQRVRQAFFVDQLELKESPQMTATEVQVRYEMMQRLLGPTLGRIQSDFLDPLITRSFWMMFRKGALPPMPQVVADAEEADLDIEYVGPLARAQKLQSVDGIQRWLGMVAEMGQMFPEMLDLPDTDEIGRYTAGILGVLGDRHRGASQAARGADAAGAGRRDGEERGRRCQGRVRCRAVARTGWRRHDGSRWSC